MADADAVASANLSRYDALLRISKTLSGHKTMAELFEVLADQLHAVVPFDYLALLLHDEPAGAMRIVVLEPPDIMPPFASLPVAEQGPAASGLGDATEHRDGDSGGRPVTPGSRVPP